MGSNETKKISIKVPMEIYERLKEYAEEHGENISEVVRSGIDKVLEGEPVKPPAPKPEPGPAPAEIPGEILGLPGRMRKLEEKAAQVDGTIDGLKMSVDRLQRQVSTFLSAYQTLLPARQQQQWSSFMEKGDFGELAEPGEKKNKKVTSKKPPRKPKK